MKMGPLPSDWHARWEEISNGDTQVDFRGGKSVTKCQERVELMYY